MQRQIPRQACPHCHVTYLDLPKDLNSDVPIHCNSCGEIVGNWSEIECAFNASGLQNGVFRFEDGVIIRIDANGEQHSLTPQDVGSLMGHNERQDDDRGHSRRYGPTSLPHSGWCLTWSAG